MKNFGDIFPPKQPTIFMTTFTKLYRELMNYLEETTVKKISCHTTSCKIKSLLFIIAACNQQTSSLYANFFILSSNVSNKEIANIGCNIF
jgi:hypothetical protein